MQGIGGALAEIAERVRAVPSLPDEAQCMCGGFDLDYPGVREVIESRDPNGSRSMLFRARCKCDTLARAADEAGRKRVRDANLPRGGPRTLENFELVTGTAEMLDAAREFLLRQGPPILVITGVTGCGKTHVLEAIGREWLAQGGTVHYEVAAKLVDRMRPHLRRRQRPRSLGTDSVLPAP